MSPFRYRDEDESPGGLLAKIAFGALAGFAVGVVVAQKTGGLSGITARLRNRFGGESAERDEALERLEEDEVVDVDSALEERVLEAFRNDPILSERPVDIGAIGDGIIELSGRVDVEEESERATTVARGVPGIETVVNRLVVGAAERQLEETAHRFEDGDPALTEAGWEGQRVGTGKRRQGRSDELARHADPKPALEDRWLSEDNALRNAAEDRGAGKPIRATGKKARGGRADGSAIAPSGVPKSDHVADPLALKDPERVD